MEQVPTQIAELMHKGKSEIEEKRALLEAELQEKIEKIEKLKARIRKKRDAKKVIRKEMKGLASRSDFYLAIEKVCNEHPEQLHKAGAGDQITGTELFVGREYASIVRITTSIYANRGLVTASKRNVILGGKQTKVIE